MSEFYENLGNNSTVQGDRYRRCSILKDNITGEVLLSTRELESIPYNIKDIYHRVNSNEISRLDLIANKYYRNPLLWWVIAQANDISDPFSPLEAGDLIRVPSMETLYSILV